MGTSNQGIYGTYKGRVGNVVGSSYKGTQVLRIRPASVRNPKTDAQEGTRMRFAMLGRFLASQRQAVNNGFKSYTDRMSAINAAMRENFHRSFTGAYPDFVLDFSKVQISKGSLAIPQGFKATAAAGAAIDLTWTDNSNEPGATEQDALIVSVYDPEQEQGEVFFSVYRRNEAAGTLNLPSSWVDRKLEVLAFFKSAADPATLKSGYEVSDTVYGGSVTLET